MRNKLSRHVISFQAILEQLRFGDICTRIDAADKLEDEDISDSVVLHSIIAILGDANPFIRRALALSLGSQRVFRDDVASNLIPMLWDADIEVARGTAASLARLGSRVPKNVEGLVRATSDKACAVRKEAAYALACCGIPGAKALIQSLKSGNQYAALPAASYGHLIREPVCAILPESTPEVRKLVLDVLLAAGEIREPDWRVFLEDPDWRVVYCAIYRLEHAGIPDGIIPILSDLLDRMPEADEQFEHFRWYIQEVHRRTLTILTKLGVRAIPACDALIRCLKRNDTDLSCMAAAAIVAIGPTALPTLLREYEQDEIGLKLGDSAQRRILRMLREFEAVPREFAVVVERLLSSTDKFVRYEAAVTLAARGHNIDQAMGTIVEILDGPSTYFRRELLELLPTWGPSAYGAVSALKRLSERSPQDKWAAEKVLTHWRS